MLEHTAHLPSSQTPTAQRKTHTNTLLSYFVCLSVRAEDAVRSLISLLTQPCIDPVLNSDASQTLTQVCACMFVSVQVSVCSVCGE